MRVTIICVLLIQTQSKFEEIAKLNRETAMSSVAWVSGQLSTSRVIKAVKEEKVNISCVHAPCPGSL